MHEVPRGAGVVLDLDDTLYPERSFHESGFRWTARTVGLDPDGPEVRAASQALRDGGRPLEILRHASGIPSATLLEWHRGHPPDIALYPDARRFLDRLGAAGIPIVILTDGRSVTQQHKIDALGIRDDVDTVLISEETGADKTTAEAFSHAAARLADRHPVIYIGDNPAKDVVHPRSLGWWVFLMLSRGDNVHPQDVRTAVQLGAATVASFDEFLVPTDDADQP